MFGNLSNNFKGIILALIGFSAFAVADATSKYLVQSYHFLQIIGITAIIMLASLLILSPFLGGLKQTFKTQKLFIHTARGILNIFVSIAIVIAFSKLPLTSVYTLIFATPFVVTLLAIPVYKEHVNIHGWISIALGFAGVLVVLRPGFADIDPWLFLPLLCVVFIGVGFLFVRALTRKETLLSLALFPVLANFIFITPLSFIFFDLPLLTDLPLFFLSSCAIILGLITTARAFRIAKTSIVSPVHYSQIIWAVGLGYFIFGDLPDFWTMIGATIIIGSGFYLIETERRAMKYPADHV